MAEILTDQDRSIQGASERLDNLTRRLLLIVIAFVPVALALAFELAGPFGTLDYPDAMNAAQIGRNVIHGRGFTTGQWLPIALSVVEPGPSMPEITSPPIYPLALALGFGTFGESDSVVKGVSAAFFILSALMVFLITRRQFSLGVAALATALFSVQFQIVRYAFAGTNISAGMFFMLLFWYALTGPGVGSPRSYFKAGVIFGLCYLTQYSFALLAPAAFVYVLKTAPARRWRGALSFVLGAVFISSPWLVRNAILTHNPLYSLSMYDLMMNTNSYGNFGVHRSFGDVPVPFAFFIGHITEVLEKLVSGFTTMYWQMPIMVGMYVLPFFVMALMFRIDDNKFQAQKNLLLAFFVLQIFGICLGDQMPMHLIKLAPLTAIFAAGYMTYLFGSRLQGPVKRAGAMAVIVILMFAPTLLELVKVATAEVVPAPPSLTDIEKSVPRDAIVLTDSPWAVAWYSQRRAVWLPLSPRQLSDMEKKIGRVKVAYISRYASTFVGATPYALAKALTELKDGDKFKVVRVYKTGDILLARN